MWRGKHDSNVYDNDFRTVCQSFRFRELPYSEDRELPYLSWGDRIRTCDHMVPNQVRYQTAPPPNELGASSGKGCWLLDSSR
jgi:hypothetical protein